MSGKLKQFANLGITDLSTLDVWDQPPPQPHALGRAAAPASGGMSTTQPSTSLSSLLQVQKDSVEGRSVAPEAAVALNVVRVEDEVGVEGPLQSHLEVDPLTPLRALDLVNLLLK